MPILFLLFLFSFRRKYPTHLFFSPLLPKTSSPTETATAPPAKAAWASPNRNNNNSNNKDGPSSSSTIVSPFSSSSSWKPPLHPKGADDVWDAIRSAARDAARDEPALASFLHTTVLVHASLAKSVAFLLANKLASRTLLGTQLASTIADAFAADPAMLDALVSDLQAVVDRDPACESYAQCLLYFKGFQALQCHRVAHHLWLRGEFLSFLGLEREGGGEREGKREREKS